MPHTKANENVCNTGPPQINRATTVRNVRPADIMVRLRVWLTLFPESNHAVGNKQKEYDEKIRPVSDNSRQNHCSFNHPRNRTPIIGEEFQEWIDFFFFNLVRPILSQSFLRFRLTESLFRRI